MTIVHLKSVMYNLLNQTDNLSSCVSCVLKTSTVHVVVVQQVDDGVAGFYYTSTLAIAVAKALCFWVLCPSISPIFMNMIPQQRFQGILIKFGTNVQLDSRMN